ncbi:hypothetical protein ACNQRL_02645 [Mycolicibacterium fortuitum]
MLVKEPEHLGTTAASLVHHEAADDGLDTPVDASGQHRPVDDGEHGLRAVGVHGRRDRCRWVARESALVELGQQLTVARHRPRQLSLVSDPVHSDTFFEDDRIVAHLLDLKRSPAFLLGTKPGRNVRDDRTCVTVDDPYVVAIIVQQIVDTYEPLRAVEKAVGGSGIGDFHRREERCSVRDINAQDRGFPQSLCADEILDGEVRTVAVVADVFRVKPDRFRKELVEVHPPPWNRLRL